MDYELALKLKSAGFKQEHGKDGGSYHIEISGDKIMIPTLSELIEACGDRFKGLIYFPNSPWKYHTFNKTPISLDIESGDIEMREGDWFVFGSTPEEAVAKFWLEINKK